MNIKNIVLTAVGMATIYKTGKLAGIAEASMAIHKELKNEHGLEMKKVTMSIWPKHSYDVKIAKVEEEAE